jgi:hypothetical protein
MADTGWRPIETAPKLGAFLVFLEEETYASRVHVMTRLQISNGVAAIVAGHFAFDMPKATHWHPLPSPPEPSNG